MKNNLKFENDPDNIISDTVNLLYESTEMMSDELSDDLLFKLWDKTNIRDANIDGNFLAELIDNVYTCYKTIKGFYIYNLETDWDGEVSESEFNKLVIYWHLLLSFERMRREGMVKSDPFKILDFDEMENIKMGIKVDETFWQSLLN